MKLNTKLQLWVMVAAALLLAFLEIPYISALTGFDAALWTDEMFLFALVIFTHVIFQDRELIQGLLNRIDVTQIGVIQDDLPSGITAEMKKAERVMLVGVSGRNYIEDFRTTFESMLAAGDEIDVLVANPASTFVAIAAARDQTEDVDYQRKRISESIEIVDGLRAHGAATVRQTDAPIDGDYIVLFNSSEVSKIYYKHYGYKTRSDLAVWLHLDAKVPDAFAYFKRHIEKLWESGR